MIVGVAVIELHVHGSQSLKAKRGVVRSISARLRNRFNVSVSEVGGQGTWQRAALGLSMTGSQDVPLRQALEKAVRFVEQTHLAQVLGSEIEMIRLPLSEGLVEDLSADGLVGESDQTESFEAIDDLPWSTTLSEADPAANDADSEEE